MKKLTVKCSVCDVVMITVEDEDFPQSTIDLFVNHSACDNGHVAPDVMGTVDDE